MSKVALLLLAAVLVLQQEAAVSAQEGLSLKDVISQALKNNPEIQAARHRLDSVKAKAGQASYLEDPEVNLEAWGVPLNHPLKVRSSNPVILGLRQKFPFFGKLGLKGEIASQEVKIVEEELRAKEQEIVTKAKGAYAELFMAQKNIEIYKELLELIRQTSKTTETLYQVGRAPQQDVFKALLEQTDLLNKLNWAEKELITSQAKLNTLMSRAPTVPIGQLIELNSAAFSIQSSELEKLALEERPELRALKAGIHRSEKAIELAQRNQKFPDFMVGLEYWVAPDERPRHMYTPMLTLTIPFSPWTKGRHDYEIEEALAERRMAQSELNAMKNMALFEVRDMSAKVEAARRSVSIYRDGLLPQSEQSFKAAIAAYQTGQVNFITLLDAQRAIRDIRLGYYKALVDYEQSLADLERAVGKKLP